MTPDATPPELPEQGELPEQAQTLPQLDGLRPPPKPRHGGRLILFAGVAGACAMGVGLGLWARPGANERMAVQAPAPVVRAARTLQVVFDDRLAPGHPAMQELPAPGAAPTAPPPPMVLPTFTPTALNSSPRPAEAPPRAPSPAPIVQTAAAEPPPAKGFTTPKLAPMLVAALAAPRMLMTRLETPKPPPILLTTADAGPKREPDAAAKKAEARRLELAQAHSKARAEAKAQIATQLAAKEQAAEARAARQQAAAETRLAQLKADKAKAAQIKLGQAKLDQTRLAQSRLAKAEAVKADHLAKLAQAKADKAESFRLAKAEAKGRAEARAEARSEALAEAKAEARKQIRLASLVRTIRRVLPHELRPRELKPKGAPVETARLDRRQAKAAARHQARVEQASLRPHKARHIVEPPSRAHVAAAPPPQHPSGLMKVSATRCGQRDPGEALVCADPNLGAADRQLARAYQGARAAGVPDAQLQRQQQRWLSARSAAAREAPWAVHDVYMARIAELNGQARDAHGDGY